MSGDVKTLVFALFIYALGYMIGPQFIGSLGRSTLKQVHLTIVSTIVVVVTVWGVARAFNLDKGTAAGILAGGATESAVIGTASDALASQPLPKGEIARMTSNIGVTYAITYLIGTFTVIWRFFLLPGVGHCGGGDGANQVDILTPLMAWVETKKTPMVIVAGKPVPQTRTGGGGFGAQGAPGAPPNYPPYADPDGPTVYTRPIYPFPNVAKYKGTGDKSDAANYEEAKGPMKTPQVFTNEAAKLVGANNQKFYKVENDNLVVDTSK